MNGINHFVHRIRGYSLSTGTLSPTRLKESPPGTVTQLMQSAGVPIARYSFETVELMKDRVEIAGMRRDLVVANARLAGTTEEEAEAQFQKSDLTVLDISFDQVRDPAERAFLKSQPTSFSLPAEAVDRLRDAAGELLRQSPEFGDYMDLLKARRIDAPETPADSSAQEAPKPNSP